MAVRPIDGDALRKELTCNFAGEPFHGNRKVTIGEVRRIIESMPTITPPPITGDTSDGCHTFNELYHHRAVLFSVVCNEQPDIAWKSKRHHDGTMYDGMFIVGINTPEGQATYHYYIDPYWELFRIKELEYAPEWDGHTPDEAIRRIGTLTPPNEPRMINADKLAKRIAGHSNYHGDSILAAIYCAAEGKENDAPIRSIETPPNEWVSVEERLPTDERPVLVFVGYADTMTGFITTSSYFCFDANPHWQWDGLVRDEQRTLFWMPLPAPPKKEHGHE